MRKPHSSRPNSDLLNKLIAVAFFICHEWRSGGGGSAHHHQHFRSGFVNHTRYAFTHSLHHSILGVELWWMKGAKLVHSVEVQSSSTVRRRGVIIQLQTFSQRATARVPPPNWTIINCVNSGSAVVFCRGER